MPVRFKSDCAGRIEVRMKDLFNLDCGEVVFEERDPQVPRERLATPPLRMCSPRLEPRELKDNNYFHYFTLR